MGRRKAEVWERDKAFSEQVEIWPEDIVLTIQQDYRN